ncbi:FMN-dependent dehydrogenase [Lipomyces orientalis]|uniref:FMN-dependent dehydrogenase n=1 Tax=Lipomyces orientalis TaxID=1233043 RepID=A0ACC3TDF6_9ASCO
MRENHAAFSRIWFRPKVLVDVSKVDLSTTMLGSPSSVPFYISAAALGKLGHQEGEVVLTRAGYRENVIQMIPTLASCSFDEIVDAKQGDQIQWLQLYVNQDREITRKIVQHAEKRGCGALWITVDAPQLGRREKDMRSKYDQRAASVQDNESTVDRSQGAARAISSFIDPSLSWKDIPWFQSITKMAIVLKGIQRAEDAIRAVEYGVDAILLSNHGGRQLDFARPAIEVLPEVMTALRRHGYEDKIEVYIDGGIRRGTDILKALCGETGVVRAIQLLKDELEMNMRLIGATRISDLSESFVDSGSIANHIIVPRDHLSSQVYDKLVAPPFVKSKL